MNSQSTAQRLDDLKRFYAILQDLENKTRGTRLLRESNGRMAWLTRGVYFFQERGENRVDTGSGRRVVRIGTHALTDGSQTSLWKRLYQHQGHAKSGGGNHRGSIFRLLVGTALMDSGILSLPTCSFPTWGKGGSARRDTREKEQPLEKLVSKAIGEMPFLWIAITDDPGPKSLRGHIERNAIALLSNYRKTPLDAPSPRWFGHHCDREKVRHSGLWNQRHVDDEYEPEFLDKLEALTSAMR